MSSQEPATHRGDEASVPLEHHVDVLHHADQVEEAGAGGGGGRGGFNSLLLDQEQLEVEARGLTSRDSAGVHLPGISSSPPLPPVSGVCSPAPGPCSPDTGHTHRDTLMAPPLSASPPLVFFIFCFKKTQPIDSDTAKLETTGETAGWLQ